MTIIIYYTAVELLHEADTSSVDSSVLLCSMAKADIKRPYVCKKVKCQKMSYIFFLNVFWARPQCIKTQSHPTQWALHPTPAENLRPGVGSSHSYNFTFLSYRLPQCKLEVTTWWSQKNDIIKLPCTLKYHEEEKELIWSSTTRTKNTLFLLNLSSPNGQILLSSIWELPREGEEWDPPEVTA